jgi:hypothetical protein
LIKQRQKKLAGEGEQDYIEAQRCEIQR